MDALSYLIRAVAVTFILLLSFLGNVMIQLTVTLFCCGTNKQVYVLKKSGL